MFSPNEFHLHQERLKELQRQRERERLHHQLEHPRSTHWSQWLSRVLSLFMSYKARGAMPDQKDVGIKVQPHGAPLKAAMSMTQRTTAQRRFDQRFVTTQRRLPKHGNIRGWVVTKTNTQQHRAEMNGTF